MTMLKRLKHIFSELPEAEQKNLLDFAEFLLSRVETIAPPLEINLIPRPTQETVVAAIKRLTQTYPMLDRGQLFNETSTLMTQHIMQGRIASEVIDNLEAVFIKHYQRVIQTNT
jgi:hypothetical protein